MQRRSARFAAVVTAGLVLAGSPAMVRAQEEAPKEQSPEELAREGAERLMRALEGLLQVIPQYGMPRIEENGDIVIPRLNPPGEQRTPEKKPEDGERRDDADDEETKQI